MTEWGNLSLSVFMQSLLISFVLFSSINLLYSLFVLHCYLQVWK